MTSLSLVCFVDALFYVIFKTNINISQEHGRTGMEYDDSKAIDDDLGKILLTINQQNSMVRFGHTFSNFLSSIKV